MMINKTALVIGATGLVGSRLLQQLLTDNSFTQVKIFVRRSTGIVHQKLQENIIDFDRIETVKNHITGDVLFSCLGTTLKQAGSKDAQYKVDYTYQYRFAQFAAENGVPAYVLISSASADARSMFFYTKIKGQLEDAVKELSFLKICILQPSVLAGERKDKRAGEAIGATIINAAGKIFPFLKKYRSISGGQVAKAMIHFYKKEEAGKVRFYQLDELFV
jgi:uncharacterized protein YbjT (DUF2867 family)